MGVERSGAQRRRDERRQRRARIPDSEDTQRGALPLARKEERDIRDAHREGRAGQAESEGTPEEGGAARRARERQQRQSRQQHERGEHPPANALLLRYVITFDAAVRSGR